jgi:ketosteroid isomerase-like protein
VSDNPSVSENLDLVGSIFEYWERGDFFSQAEWAHPEIEVVIADGPEPGRAAGLDGLARAARSRLGGVDEVRIEVERYWELDDERILALTRRSGRGKASGLEIGQLGMHGAHVFHIREGKVRRMLWYFDRERALADLGLTPDTGT